MDEILIKEIRQYLISKLEKYNRKPVLLDLESDLLSEIIFDTVRKNGSYAKVFALDEDILRKIDFSNISFDGVLVENVNFFPLTGVRLHPQKVFDKSFYNTRLCDVTILGDMESYRDVYISGADFTDALGNVTINPQIVRNRELEDCNFKYCTFVNHFNECSITGSNFKGSEGAIIDPQTIRYKDLSRCDFADVEFDGSFEGCRIVETCFMKSTGALIPYSLYTEYSTIDDFTDFSDTTILVDDINKIDLNSIKGFRITVLDFKAICNNLMKYINDNKYDVPDKILFNGIREYFKKYLKCYSGNSIVLDLDEDILKKLLFINLYEGDTTHRPQLRFAYPIDLLMKINFSNVSFDNVDVRNICFTGLKGVKINPQTVYDKNLCLSKFRGVEFIGPFDGVIIEGADFRGSDGPYLSCGKSNPKYETKYDEENNVTKLGNYEQSKAHKEKEKIKQYCIKKIDSSIL